MFKITFFNVFQVIKIKVTHCSLYHRILDLSSFSWFVVKPNYDTNKYKINKIIYNKRYGELIEGDIE